MALLSPAAQIRCTVQTARRKARSAGERLALYVQNNPGFVIGLLGAWKAGGAAVAVNPMNKGRELAYLLADSGAKALLCLDSLYRAVAGEVIASGETRVDTVITTSEL